jgi:hypothetical protein
LVYFKGEMPDREASFMEKAALTTCNTLSVSKLLVVKLRGNNTKREMRREEKASCKSR